MKIYLVGGAVRDQLLWLPIKERDWVVVGATPEELIKQGYRQVGKDFPVFLHPKTNEEYALARMERKVGAGYKGFTFDSSPTVTLEEDLIRRDLTINAMAESEDGQIIDPYQGQEDLKKRLLRHVSPAFSEDPVRILRVGRFAARYAYLGFKVAPETTELMRDMVKAGEVNALVAERVWKEFERALTEKNPEQFFQVLADCDALALLFPHLTLSGPGIHALKHAAKLTTDGCIRFAALLHALPEDDIDDNKQKHINYLCERYKAPATYKELALLTATLHPLALKDKSLNAEELLKLYSAADAFRREDRFKQFLTACKAIALTQNKEFDRDWLLDVFQSTKNIASEPLLAQGLTGLAFANELNKQRLEKIQERITK